jgi:hypothetical protein
VSLVLFIVALRHVGTARAGAYYSIAPFFGAILAVALGEPVTSGARSSTGSAGGITAPDHECLDVCGPAVHIRPTELQGDDHDDYGDHDDERVGHEHLVLYDAGRVQ